MRGVLERREPLEGTMLRRGNTLTGWMEEGVAPEMSHGKTGLEEQAVTKCRMGGGRVWFGSSKCEKDGGTS